MNVMEMAILFGFGVPLVLITCAFVVMAAMMQMAEGEREFAPSQQ